MTATGCRCSTDCATVARTGECSCFAFDLLELNGWDVRREPHPEKRRDT